MVPPVEKKLDAQSTEECPLSIVPVATKEPRRNNGRKDGDNIRNNGKEIGGK